MNVSWAAYHADHQELNDHVITPTALLPLFEESAHTVPMIKHALDVVKKSVEYLNPGQVPVLTFDQPLYALAKQIQWKWPDEYGEGKFVMMFGGLHIEMAALKTAGDWLQGSGWTQALVQAEIASAGVAESFLRATHVTRTRRAHQITAAALNILQHCAYSHYHQEMMNEGDDPLSFNAWCQQRTSSSPQFAYWASVMALEVCILVNVHSLREANFEMYLDSLTELTQWFFALDHTHYACWVPVHLRDMAELGDKHPAIK